MQEAVNAPLYLDWSFWTALVAVIAIILSQIPPIHQILKKAKLEVDLYSRLHITHKVGNPNLQLYLIIRNIGGRIVRIKRISAAITRDGNSISTLPVQNYLKNPNDTNTVLFTSLSLKPGEEWAHFINLLNYFNRTEEKKYKDNESKLKENIFKKKQGRPETDIVEADEQYVTPIIEFFKQKFVWLPGEYNLQLNITTEHSAVDIEKSYRFTLFESYSEELAKYKEDYKFGVGIYINSLENMGVNIEIFEV